MGRGILAEICGTDNTWPGNKLQATGEEGGIKGTPRPSPRPFLLWGLGETETQIGGMCLQDEGFSAEWPQL